MPPHKKPVSLNSQCIKIVNKLIINSCQIIDDKYEDFSSNECQNELNFIQEYLLSKIPVLVLEEVVNEWDCFNTSYRDNRILCKVFTHRAMKKLDATKFMQPLFSTADCRSQILRLEQFWIDHLPQFKNLIDLNLHLICTDEILQVVGENCINLQRIDIVSRRRDPTQYDFNALKIKFCVSDAGLKHLSKCVKLKEVIMNTILSKNFEGSMTVSGIRSLVKDLPQLERISYNDMGSVLIGGMEDVTSLPLLALTCQSATPGHIEAISRLCPRVNCLTLYAPYYTMPDCDVETKTLVALSESNLTIVTLDLRNFRGSEALWNLLRTKGYHIKSLGLKLRSAVCTLEVEGIGTSCPNINSLHLFAQAVDNRGYRYNPSRPLFRRLERLCLGVSWPGVPVYTSFTEMCLSHALDIQQFILFHLEPNGSDNVNAMWERIMCRNPMRLLEHLHINTTMALSWRTVSRLISSCPLLVTLTVPLPESVSDKEHFLKLKEEILAKNLDLEYNIADVLA